MKKILFLGDSITDCDHCFTPDNLGNGFVKLIAKQLGSKAHVTNGGTDGFTYPRIYQKWKNMYASISYDAVVITGGINEVCVLESTGFSRLQADCYLKDCMNACSDLLRQLVRQQTQQIIVVEPFLFEQFSMYYLWADTLNLIRRNLIQITNEINEQINTCPLSTSRPYQSIQYLSVQDSLNHLQQTHKSEPLTTDGIHPTALGHLILAQRILSLL